MIDILVSGSPLAIPVDTAITMQQTAPWSDLDNISSDIVWTFDIPAKPNQRLLDQAGYTIVSNHKRYDAEFRYMGIPLAKGQLYIQQATDEKTLSCGATLAPFPDGWASKKLSENTYDTPQEIATSASNYQTAWLAFLASTLSSDSTVKFFPFVDQEFMADNEAFGYHLNQLSHLENSLVQNLMSKWVNRLFFDAQDNIVQSPPIFVDGVDTQKQGVRIFNTATDMGSDALVNGYHFAPAIRLDYIVRKAFESAGMDVVGSFLAHPNVKKLFSQSLNAMDGNLSQYPIVQTIRCFGDIHGTNVEASNVGHSFPCTIDSRSAKGFTIDSMLISEGMTTQFNLTLPCITLSSGTVTAPETSVGWADTYEEVIFLVFRSDDESPLPTHRADLFSDRTTGHKHVYGNLKTYAQLTAMGVNPSQEIPVSNGDKLVGDGRLLQSPSSAIMMQLTPSKYNETSFGSNATETYNGSDIICAELLTGTPSSMRFYPQLVKAKVKTWSEERSYVMLKTSEGDNLTINFTSTFSPIEEIYDYEVIDDSLFDYYEPSLNVFSRYLDIAKHVPNLTNAELVKALCEFFGLNFFYSSSDGLAQLSFFNDIFAAQAMDVSDYVTGERKLNYDPKHYELSISPVLKEADANDDKFIEDVTTAAELPLPQTRRGRYVFVKSENRYRLAERCDDGTGTERWSWSASHGTKQHLEVGDESIEATNLDTSIKVPNMRMVDTQHTPKYVNEIPCAGCSKMFQDSFSGEFDMILQQYRGKRLVQLQSLTGGISEAYIEDANPTNYNQDGTTDTTAINLTATGDNSVGEMWLRPYYNFLATAEDVELTLSLPADKFMALYRLMSPQEGPSASHTRWIFYKGQRYLPKQISYQFTNSPRVTATVTASREHYDD